MIMKKFILSLSGFFKLKNNYSNNSSKRDCITRPNYALDKRKVLCLSVPENERVMNSIFSFVNCSKNCTRTAMLA